MMNDVREVSVDRAHGTDGGENSKLSRTHNPDRLTENRG
jgi:hypothetical protein